ncbi:MAG: metallophosphoesterase [Planctomycetaceae bacterium]
MPRTLAIGDIHGCDVALDALLELVAPAGGDLVVVLGDVVDRGPGSKQAIDRLLALRDACRLVFLQGNHEDMLLRAIDGEGWIAPWLEFGGYETLRSYGAVGKRDGLLRRSLARVFAGRPQRLPSEHVEFLRAALPWFETDDAIFVHANLEPGVPLDRQKPDWLLWKHLTGDERPHPSGKRVVCGHTSQKHGCPVTLDGWVCIDTHAYGGQRLTCLDVATDTVWQTSQEGEAFGPRRLSDIARPFDRRG